MPPEPAGDPAHAGGGLAAGSRGRPMVVRLRNWVGDVTLALPMLQRLAAAGFALHLVGKPWARDLLAGTGWPVTRLPVTLRERVALLRRLRDAALGDDPRFSGQPVQALCLPDSFSSALEFRLAGLRALGHAHEGRSLLLGRAVQRPPATHEALVYWALGSALLGADAAPPARIGLRTTAAQRRTAAALCGRHALGDGPVLVCPFAGGTWSGQDKTWPGFAAFVAGPLRSLGRPIAVCPGPGVEEALARSDFSGATLLAGVDLGTYAALLERASLMVSNDTGPGHMAAAVGTPLLTVLGPSDASLWRPWGEPVMVLGGGGRWPDGDAALAAARALLERGRAWPVPEAS